MSILFSCNKGLENCKSFTKPIFDGTIFISPNILTPSDPSSFETLKYYGKETRTMFDRRVDDWINIEPYIFIAKFNDNLSIEIQVNPEFKSIEGAKLQAEKFAPIIGQLTTELRKDVQTVWIHKGLKPFGGGNNNLLIHTDWSIKHYEDQGILEETFIHEAAHTSLDSIHSKNSNWLKAQKDDCTFISKYAEKNPYREDIAESYLPYFAIRYKSERIRNSLKDSIELAIPNRIKYFDKQNFNMYPVNLKQ